MVMDKLERKISDPPRGPDGYFIQPGKITPDIEKVWNHNRDRAANHGHYADEWVGNARTIDRTGVYGCGGDNGCNMERNGLCVALAPSKKLPQRKGGVGPVNLKIGSCPHYENKCAGDPEIVLNRLDPEGYGVPKNGKGWSCLRCPLAELIRGGKTDSVGRTLYCRFWDCSVQNIACCEYNAAPEVDGPTPEEDIEEDAEEDKYSSGAKSAMDKAISDSAEVDEDYD